MINIELNGKLFENVPENYDEMYLKHFIRQMKIQNKKDEYKSSLAYTIDLIASIIGCDGSDLYSLNMDEVNELAENFDWLSELPEKRQLDVIEINGINYKLRKNNQLTLGEQVSIETFLKEDLNNSDNFHLVMSILLRPAHKNDLGEWIIDDLENDIDSILKRGELFKNNLRMNDIYGSLVFFSNGEKESTIKTSKGFSIRKVK